MSRTCAKRRPQFELTDTFLNAMRRDGRTPNQLADAVGVPRKHFERLINRFGHVGDRYLVHICAMGALLNVSPEACMRPKTIRW